MSDGMFITKTDWNTLVKKIAYLESFIKNTIREKSKSKWMNQQEAMQEIGCKSRKLQELRMSGVLEWRYAGKGRLVMILRKSVEKYNEVNSSILTD